MTPTERGEYLPSPHAAPQDAVTEPGRDTTASPAKDHAPAVAAQDGQFDKQETPKADKWREMLRAVGGLENELVAVPAGGVRKLIDEFEQLERELEESKDAEARTRERLETVLSARLPTAEELRLQILLESYGRVLLRIKQRRCTNVVLVGDSACECCQHHWQIIEDEQRKYDEKHSYVGEKK